MRKNRPGLFAMTGGLLQIGMSLSVLFLPIVGGTCTWQGQVMSCRQESYIEMGGNVLGYGFLFLMIAVGVMAIVSTRIDNPTWSCRFRWLGVLASVSFVVIGAWSIGLLFLPGAVFLLVAALACRQQIQNDRQVA
jgi:hypothetical protein